MYACLAVSYGARWKSCSTWTCPIVQFLNSPTSQMPSMRADPVLAPQEANYGHQQELDMIPLMMQKDYSPKGWLGLILGTRLWYATNCVVFPLLSFSSVFSD